LYQRIIRTASSDIDGYYSLTESEEIGISSAPPRQTSHSIHYSMLHNASS
jgi:hypothetical protein